MRLDFSFFARPGTGVRFLLVNMCSDVFADHDLRNAPPYLSSRLAEKKDSAAPGVRKKRALTRVSCSMPEASARG